MRRDLHVVSGPPGGGKTTYAHKKAGRKGTVVDVDELAMKRSPQGTKPYQYSGAARAGALRDKEDMISRHIANPKNRMVVVDTKPTEKSVKRYNEAGAKKHMMDPGRDKALKRVASSRPAHFQYPVHDWYDKQQPRLKEAGYKKPMRNFSNKYFSKSEFELGPRLKGIELKGSDCINWPGATRNGYGVKKQGHTTVPAHKYVFEQSTGKKVPKGWNVDHTCRNRMCVNPKHLEPVSPGENKKRAWAYKLGTYQHKNYKGESKDGKLVLVKPKEEKTPVEAVKVEKSLPKRSWDDEPTTLKDLGEKYKKERNKSARKAAASVAGGAAMPAVSYQALKRIAPEQAGALKPNKKTIALGAASGAVMAGSKIATGVRSARGKKRVDDNKVTNVRQDWRVHQKKSERDDKIASTIRNSVGAGAAGAAAVKAHRVARKGLVTPRGPNAGTSTDRLVAGHKKLQEANIERTTNAFVGAGLGYAGIKSGIEARKAHVKAKQQEKDDKIFLVEPKTVKVKKNLSTPAIPISTKRLEKWNRQSAPDKDRVDNVRRGYAKSGKIDPVKVYPTRWLGDGTDSKTPKLDLVDGRHRLALAKEKGIKRLPTKFTVGNPKHDRKGPPANLSKSLFSYARARRGN